jgi:GNAT superfamily N-acetyltransferase
MYEAILPDSIRAELQNDGKSFAIGAVADGVACGVLVVNAAQDWAAIEYLAVSDSYRRRGVATELIQTLCRLCYPSTTPVLCTFAASDEQDSLYRFFADRYDFTVAEESGFLCNVPIAEVVKVAERLQSAGGAAKNVRPFFQLANVERWAFEEKMRKLREGGGFYPPGIFEKRARVIEPLCLCDRAEQIDAVVFFEDLGDGDLELSFAWCEANFPKSLMGLLAEAGRRINESNYGKKENGTLTISAVTPASQALVTKLFPDAAIIDRFFTASWDMTAEAWLGMEVLNA